MAIKNKEEVISESARHDKDTGSPEVQVAILTKRIEELTEHLKKNKHDIKARRSLLKLVADRRKFVLYLNKNSKKK